MYQFVECLDVEEVKTQANVRKGSDRHGEVCWLGLMRGRSVRRRTRRLCSCGPVLHLPGLASRNSIFQHKWPQRAASRQLHLAW